MSNKKDERDIDEILASIDKMLGEKDTSTPIEDVRKNSVKEAAQASKDKLKISSSVEEPELQSFDDVDMDAFVSLGLDGDKASDDQAPDLEDDVLADTVSSADNINDDVDATSEHENHENLHDEAKEEAPPIGEPSETTIENTVENEGSENITPQRILLTEELLEPSAQEALPLWIEQEGNAESESTDFEHVEPEAVEEEREEQDDTLEDEQPDMLSPELPDESDEESKSSNINDDIALSEEDAAILSNIEDVLGNMPKPSIESALQPVQRREDDINQDDAEHRELGKDKEDDKGEDKFDDVFKSIANDDTITFDIEEDIGIDTVYKLEKLDDNTELVEAMLDDVLDEESSSSEKDKAMPELSALTTPFDDESIKALVQIVSDDIATQVNEHLQTWLPGLIKTSIKKHLNKINNQ